MIKLVGIVVLAVVVPVLASADQMTFGGAVDNVIWAGPESVYVSPYTATDTAPNAGSPIAKGTSIEIYCLDWNHDINSGQKWTADVFSLNPITSSNESSLYYTNPSNMPASAYTINTVAGHPGKVQLTQVTNLTQAAMYLRYLEAAYLFDQIRQLNLTTPSAATVLQQTELNVAAWTLFLDVNPPITTSTTTAAAFATAINKTVPSNLTNSPQTFANDVYNDVECAIAHVTGALGGTCTTPVVNTNHFGGDFAARGWYAVTPDPKTSGNLTQEFLTYIPPSPPPQNTPSVPEPASWALLATATLFVSWKGRRIKE